MRMLCAVESGTLVPPQPWRGAELFPLAAGAGVNAAKPHQGITSKKPALHQGQTACNSTTALGLSWSWQSGTAPGAGVTYDYDAWGNVTNQTGSTPNVYLYRGEQYDADLSLYYLRERYFSPLTGRFLTRDPEEGKIKDPQTLHKYLYTGGDPVNRTDPSGRNYMETTFPLVVDIGALLATAAKTAAVVAVSAGIACVWEKAVNELVVAAAAAGIPTCGPAYTQPMSPLFQMAGCSTGKWNCNAQCQVKDFSHGGNTTWGPPAGGAGNTETQACQDAKKNASALSPRGTHSRHCKCFGCEQR